SDRPGDGPRATADPPPDQPVAPSSVPESPAPAAPALHSGFHPVATASHHRPHADAHPTGRRLAILSLTALGIVYGDIGTSPLYALQQCFTSKEFSIPATQANIFGLLSLIVWLLILVVAVKYIVFIMRADNHGEGGILALMALILQSQRRSDRK